MNIRLEANHYRSENKGYSIVAIYADSHSLVIRQWGKVGTTGQIKIERTTNDVATTGLTNKYHGERIKGGYHREPYKDEVSAELSRDDVGGLLKKHIGTVHALTMSDIINTMFDKEESDEEMSFAPPALTIDKKQDGEGYDDESWGTW